MTDVIPAGRGTQRGSLHLDKFANDLASFIAAGDPDELLSASAVMQIIHVSGATLENWRKKNIGPPFVILGPRIIRYRRGDLVVWLRSRSQKAEVPKTKTAPASKQKR